MPRTEDLLATADHPIVLQCIMDDDDSLRAHVVPAEDPYVVIGIEGANPSKVNVLANVGEAHAWASDLVAVLDRLLPPVKEAGLPHDQDAQKRCEDPRTEVRKQADELIDAGRGMMIVYTALKAAGFSDNEALKVLAYNIGAHA